MFFHYRLDSLVHVMIRLKIDRLMCARLESRRSSLGLVSIRRFFHMRSSFEIIFFNFAKLCSNQVRRATPTVDMDPPAERLHVFFDAKKLQLERERQTRIVQDNFILLKKLQNIMHGSSVKKHPLTQRKSKCIRTRWMIIIFTNYRSSCE